MKETKYIVSYGGGLDSTAMLVGLKEQGMTKLDKLQLELYPIPDFNTCSGPIDYEKRCEKISALRSAFRLGAARAEGAFAEWCDNDGWKYQGNHLWEQSCVKGNGTRKTTAQLYQLWQQSLS